MSNDLPPDPDNMNDSRASWAAAALQTFKSSTGSNSARVSRAMESFAVLTGTKKAKENPETILGDLLCNLRHLADRTVDADAIDELSDFKTEISKWCVGRGLDYVQKSTGSLAVYHDETADVQQISHLSKRGLKP
jgi:hypothetical protein